MKRLSFLIGVILVLVISSCVVEEDPVLKSGGFYNCDVNSCDEGIKVLNIDSSDNAHVGLPNSSEYGLYVCCNSSKTGEFTMNDNTSPAIFTLSDESNAHVGDSDDYDYPFGFDGVSCSLKAECGEAEFCVFDFEGNVTNTNAHVSSCGSTYDWSVCCGYGIDVDPEEGCTDENAHNYDLGAIIDDGNCETCSDNTENGGETGIDCGGDNCAPCPEDESCGLVNTYWGVYDSENGWEQVGSTDDDRTVYDAQPVQVVVEGNIYCSEKTVNLELHNTQLDDDPDVIFPETLNFNGTNIALDYWYVSGCNLQQEDPDYKFNSEYSGQIMYSGIINVLCDETSDTCGDGYYDLTIEDCDLSDGGNQCGEGNSCVSCSCVDTSDFDCQNANDGVEGVSCSNQGDCDGTFTILSPADSCSGDYACGTCDDDNGGCDDECTVGDLTLCESDEICNFGGSCNVCVSDVDVDLGGSNCNGYFSVTGDCEPCDPSEDCEYGGQKTQSVFMYSETGIFDSSSSCYEGNTWQECYNYGYLGGGDYGLYCDEYTELTPRDCYVNLEEEVPFYDWLSVIFTLMILTSYYIISRKQKVL